MGQKHEFDNRQPIYIQIIDIIKMKIISKEVLPGEKISSVREFSEIFGVNPNTVQKALVELEREGLIFTERTLGKFITKDKNVLNNVRNKVANEKTDEYLKDMFSMGFSLDEVKQFIKI